MSHQTCRACRGDRLRKFLDLGMQPLAGAFLPDHSAIAGEVLFPTQLYVCEDCGLVQHLDPIDPDVLFKKYNYSSSTVKPLIDHFGEYAAYIRDELNAGLVVEFGCNDGILLDQLRRIGVKSVGVDISENITELARSKGLDVVTGYFGPETARAIVERVGKCDVVTGSNCFAHNDEPEPILEAARIALKDEGVFIVECIYAGDLHQKWQWDTLYHEHLSTYSLHSMQALLRRMGFSLVDVFHVPMHAGSIRVVASPKWGRQASDRVKAMLKEEARIGLNTAATWEQFGDAVHRNIDIVGKTMRDLAQKNRIWGYGASGRSTMWVNACQMGYLEKMVDASPLRANKLMPGTHTPIVLPPVLREADPPPDYILITAWNYFDVIRAQEPWFKGIWVTPLPRFTME